MKDIKKSLALHGNPSRAEVQDVVDRVWQSLQTTRPEADSEINEEPELRGEPRFSRLAWAAATAVLAVASILSVRVVMLRNNVQAAVEKTEGGLQRISDRNYEDLVPGESIAFGEMLRSNIGSGSVLRLKDGSRVELRSNSELMLERAEDGIRIRLHTGSVIVSAASQRTGHLYVQTRDLTASVVGTVFVVNAEESGSRVAVLQGEVHVEQGIKGTNLSAGEQVLTNSLMERRPVAREVSWSQDAESHLALLELAELQIIPPKSPKFDTASIKTLEPAGVETMNRDAVRFQCQAADGAIDSIDVLQARIFETLGVSVGSPSPVHAPRGRCIGNYVTLEDMIHAAYGIADASLRESSVRGGADWTRQLRFQIQARAENPESATREQLQQMLQALLEERFKLKLSWQTREIPGYVLLPGKDGVNLPEASTEEPLKMTVTTTPEGAKRSINGKTSMKAFADFIANRPPIPGPVLDRTNQMGIYAFTLSYLVPPNVPAGGADGRRGGGGELGGESPAFRNFHKALQELGLRLEAARIPTDVVVIEQVEKPTEN